MNIRFDVSPISYSVCANQSEADTRFGDGQFNSPSNRSGFAKRIFSRWNFQITRPSSEHKRLICCKREFLSCWTHALDYSHVAPHNGRIKRPAAIYASSISAAKKRLLWLLLLLLRCYSHIIISSSLRAGVIPLSRNGASSRNYASMQLNVARMVEVRLTSSFVSYRNVIGFNRGFN